MIVTWGISCQACFDPLVDHCLMSIYFNSLLWTPILSQSPSPKHRLYYNITYAQSLSADLLGVPNTMALTFRGYLKCEKSRHI